MRKPSEIMAIDLKKRTRNRERYADVGSADAAVRFYSSFRMTWATEGIHKVFTETGWFARGWGDIIWVNWMEHVAD